MKRADLKAVVIGGGTGSFTILNSLKKYVKHITALVNMVDDGGSTGILRDELGALPPGDVRQCLVALSDSEQLRELFSYRFDSGTFQGHSFGNILLTALEKSTGSFANGVEMASEILRINGRVLPVTLDDVRLKMEWTDESVILNGEHVIDADHFKHDPRKAELSLVPDAKANPAAIKAIEEADFVVIAPGDIYTSIGPVMVTEGISRALQNTNAKIFYICNLVTKEGQTTGFTVSDHVAEIERFAGTEIIDYVLFNNHRPSDKTIELYTAEGSELVEVDEANLEKAHYQVIEDNFLGSTAKRQSQDALAALRSLIRHNGDAVSQKILEVFKK